MPGVLEIVGAVYEVSTVVTDIVLNGEYIQRNWKEEYALSIAFLVFNGVVMALVGLQLEAQDGARRRYARWAPLNTAVGALLGLLQLRVLVETLYAFAADRQAEKTEKNNGEQDDDAAPYAASSPTPDETPAQRAARLAEGLAFAAFVQAMVRDVPVFIIQANATIHYRKWKFVDLWAVASTGVTLLNAVSGYATKHQQQPPKPGAGLAWAATLFLLGQFVFRLGAILLVATTTGLTIVAFAGAITCIAVGAAVALRLATPAQATGAQAASALLFFPLFTVFSLDAAHVGPRVGNVKRALYSRKLLVLNAWRVVENAAGVLLAVALPRYTDFGASSDREIALIGLACAAFYLASLLVFVAVARATPSTGDQREDEDTTLYLQNAAAPATRHAPFPEPRH